MITLKQHVFMVFDMAKHAIKATISVIALSGILLLALLFANPRAFAQGQMPFSGFPNTSTNENMTMMGPTNQSMGENMTLARVVMQVDLAGNYAAFNHSGFFKLLADFTDMHAILGHVAISNVPCYNNGSTPFVVVLANANVGANNTVLTIKPLNASNLIDDLSFKGSLCTYHIGMHEGDLGMDASGCNVPITDIALANSERIAHTILPEVTASATIHADLAR